MHKMTRKVLSLALALALCLALLPAAALAAQAGDTSVTDEEGTYALSNPISKVDSVPEDIEAFIRQNGSDSQKINGLYVVPAGTTITSTNPETGVSYLASDGIGDSGSVTVTAGKYMIVWGHEFHVFYADRAPGDFQILEGGILDEYTGSGGAVTIPDNITVIAEQAFIDCGNVTSVTIPSSVTSIEQYAFYGCTGLKSVAIPSSVTSLSEGVFSHCSGLTSVTIPISVTSMGKWLFLDCANLKDIYFGGSEAQWKAIKVEDSGNDILKSATIHYNSTGPDQSTTPTTPVIPDQPATLPTVENIPAAGTAVAQTQNVLLDGKEVEFQAYAVKDANGNMTNYVKVRDLAMALNGTKAQFNVGWDGKISITSNTAYEVQGTEGSTPYSGDQPYTAVSDTPVSFNGSDVNLTSFQLKDSAGSGYTYYKLRDLGQLLNFNVTWNGSSIVVESDKPYTG